MAKLDEITQELLQITPRDSGYADLGKRAAETIAVLREYLEAIESMANDEINARFKHPSKTPEEVAGKSAIFTMLVLPRNMARTGLDKAGRT